MDTPKTTYPMILGSKFGKSYAQLLSNGEPPKFVRWDALPLDFLNGHGFDFGFNFNAEVVTQLPRLPLDSKHLDLWKCDRDRGAPPKITVGEAMETVTKQREHLLSASMLGVLLAWPRLIPQGNFLGLGQNWKKDGRDGDILFNTVYRSREERDCVLRLFWQEGVFWVGLVWLDEPFTYGHKFAGYNPHS